MLIAKDVPSNTIMSYINIDITFIWSEAPINSFYYDQGIQIIFWFFTGMKILIQIFIWKLNESFYHPNKP